MVTVLIDDLDKRVVADAEAGASQRRATSRRGLRGLNIGHRVRLWQRQDHVRITVADDTRPNDRKRVYP